MQEISHHFISKRRNAGGQLVTNAAAAVTTTSMDNLAIIKQIATALNEYIAMKE
jgi:hypothetical protein